MSRTANTACQPTLYRQLPLFAYATRRVAPTIANVFASPVRLFQSAGSQPTLQVTLVRTPSAGPLVVTLDDDPPDSEPLLAHGPWLPARPGELPAPMLANCATKPMTQSGDGPALRSGGTALEGVA